ncbi:MAG: signal peptidase [Planctomycetes bacterium]|nr:signal peptidase [Planctomycetota bacterium]
MSKNTVTRPKQVKNKKYMLVRHSRMNTIGLFEHHETKIPKVHTRVVIKTNKGLELGHLVGQLSLYRAGQLKFDSGQIKKYFEDSNIDISIDKTGKFVRFATSADISEERHLQKIADEEMECCRRFVKELDLPMKIVDAEHIFGGERVIFYFMSDGRVDFRDLVKKIAHEYQTRIEMRQIGSRDEAKILGDVESCGQQCCCQRFLKLLKPVNMRMAKMQKATLDPSKISGYCGRLKCCLRYEDKTYTELKKRLPKKSTKVKTKHGQGKVIGTQILTQLVMIETGDGQRIAVPLDELEVIPSPATPKKKKDSTPPKNQQDNVENKNDSQTRDSAGPPKQ